MVVVSVTTAYGNFLSDACSAKRNVNWKGIAVTRGLREVFPPVAPGDPTKGQRKCKYDCVII